MGYTLLMDESPRAEAQRRLARIAGQVNGIRRMLDEDRSCSDVLVQISAVRAALDKLGAKLVATHLESCMCSLRPNASGESAELENSRWDELVEEVRNIMGLFAR